jgi:TatD DNase family protein
MLIDIHCHLDHFYYKDDLNKIIKRAEKENILIVTNGVDFHTNNFSLELAKKHKNIKAALGFYPEDALDREVYFEEQKNNAEINTGSSKKGIKDVLEQMEKHKNEFIAFGEIGLDLFNGKKIEEQKQKLGEIIKFAVKLNKPLILHSRKAERELLEFLKEFGLNPDKVILHCFSGRKSLIKEAVERGYNFSIPTNIARNETFQFIVQTASLSKLFTETDAPYLSPYKNPDGSFNRNEPINVKETIKFMAKIKNLPEAEIERQIFDNFKRVFESKV